MHRFSVSLNRRFIKWCLVVVFTFLAILTIHRAFLLPAPIADNIADNKPVSFETHRKFAFMKNHKCGSSTIENIIFRFAKKNNLNIVLPESGNYLSTTELFNHKSLADTKWKDLPFDIFSLHNRWNRKEVMKVLEDEVPTFTIVRDPVDVFVSMFHYQDKFKEFYGVKDIHEMVLKIQENPASPQLNQRWMKYVGRNQISWDLGLSPDIYDNEEAMKKEIERLDHEFDLVMLANRMDESLVLLMHLMNWKGKDVVHLDLNRRKPDKSSPLNNEEIDVLSNWLAADVQIFKYFSRRFDERVAELNEEHSSLDLFDSVVHSGLDGFDESGYVNQLTQLLKEANAQLYEQCVIQEVGNEKLSGVFKETNDNILGYVINEEQEGCALFAMSEPAFLKIFRNKLLSDVIKAS